ncbi:BlaI/MecI/CopY family transcriptional regulator [bacterium]|nr:BlaI/MecI/CopY family transcriptional regulator [bacterium]
MKLSDAEWHLMNALWEDYPATARDIMKRLDSRIQWAYTTVKTMLTRLVGKNAMSEEKKGNTSFYTPLVSQKKAQRSALKSLVDKVLGGTVEPIMHYLVEEKKLTSEERHKLIRLLEDMDHTAEENKNEPD